MSGAELGGSLFLFLILVGLPGWLFWVFGGWPCVGIFAGYLVMSQIAARASEWK
jgi:hypothetical protein